MKSLSDLGLLIWLGGVALSASACMGMFEIGMLMGPVDLVSGLMGVIFVLIAAASCSAFFRAMEDAVGASMSPMTLEEELWGLRASWSASAGRCVAIATVAVFAALLWVVPCIIWLLEASLSWLVLGLLVLYWALWTVTVAVPLWRSLRRCWDQVRGVRIMATGSTVQVETWVKGQQVTSTSPLRGLSVKSTSSGLTLRHEHSATAPTTLRCMDAERCALLAAALEERSATAACSGSPQEVPAGLSALVQSTS